MKKTLIALSVLVAAGSVNAATMYKADGLSVDVFADFDVVYEAAPGDDVKAAIKLDDADFGFSVTSEVSDNFKVLGYANWDGGDRGPADGTTKNVQLDNGWAGVQIGDFTVKAGRLNNFVDDIGVDHDQAIGGSYEGWKAGDIEDKSNQVIKASYDNGEMFYAGIALTQFEDGTDADDKSQVDGVVGVRYAGADVNLTVIKHDAATGEDTDGMVLEAKYKIDAFTLGALYGTSEKGSVDEKALALSGKYTMDKFTFGLAWSSLDKDGADAKQWYANTTYALSSNAKAYVEIADTDADNVDLGYAVGLKVSF